MTIFRYLETFSNQDHLSLGRRNTGNTVIATRPRCTKISSPWRLGVGTIATNQSAAALLLQLFGDQISWRNSVEMAEMAETADFREEIPEIWTVCGKIREKSRLLRRLAPKKCRSSRWVQ